MPDVHVDQHNSPPASPPPDPDRGSGIWVIVIVLLVIGAVLVWFILTRSEGPGELDTGTDVEVTVPQVETPEVEVPEVEAPEIDVEVPEEIDIDVNQPDSSTAQQTDTDPSP